MATSLHKKGLIAVSDKIILEARKAMEFIKLFVTDFSVSDERKQYETVNVKTCIGAVNKFEKGVHNYVKGNGKVDYADIVLTENDISNFTFDDLDVLEDEFNPDWAKLGPACGRKLGYEAIKAMVGLLTYSYAETTKTLAASVAASTYADFVALRSKTIAAGYDPADCVVLLEPTAYDHLVALMDYKTTGDSSIADGAIIGAKIGFRSIMNSPNCSKISGAAVSGVSPQLGVGFVVPSDALGFANRQKKAIKGAQGNIIEAGYTQDEETGLIVSTRVVLNTDDGECTWNAETLYGVARMKQSHTINGESVANGAPGFVQLLVEG